MIRYRQIVVVVEMLLLVVMLMLLKHCWFCELVVTAKPKIGSAVALTKNHIIICVCVLCFVYFSLTVSLLSMSEKRIRILAIIHVESS